MKKGVLLVNLGSPDSPEPKDVKPYLSEFLMDERVIDVPLWLRTFIVKGIILNTRPKASSQAYKKIWWEEGSPLLVISERLKTKVQKQTDLPVALAMRYGSLTIKKGLQELVDQGVDEVFLMPLYPQFAMATTETILVLAERIRTEHFPNLKITDLKPFYNQKAYIDVLSTSIKRHLKHHPSDYVLFSYHGVPERHIYKRDITKSHCKIDRSCCTTPSPAHEFCYRHQCLEVTRLVAETLNLEAGTYSTSFQSRLGFDPWLKPATDLTLERLGKQGIQSLAVVTPAFVSDCLETLEEIAMEGQNIFLEMGGRTFTMIPCLNDDNDFVDLLSKWIKDWATSELIFA